MAFKAGILVGPKQTTFIPAFEFSGIKNEHQEVTAIQSDKLTAPLFSMQTVKDVEKKIITVCSSYAGWLERDNLYEFAGSKMSITRWQIKSLTDSPLLLLAVSLCMILSVIWPGNFLLAYFADIVLQVFVSTLGIEYGNG
jgi:hypothetical protein